MIDILPAGGFKSVLDALSVSDDGCHDVCQQPDQIGQRNLLSGLKICKKPLQFSYLMSKHAGTACHRILEPRKPWVSPAGIAIQGCCSATTLMYLFFKRIMTKREKEIKFLLLFQQSFLYANGMWELDLFVHRDSRWR